MRKMFNKVLVFIVFNICFIICAAFPAEGETIFELDPVSVTATRPGEFPSQESFRLELDGMSVLPGQTLTAAAGSAPFVFMPSGGGPGAAASPCVMGGSSAQTLVLLDGRPVNSPALGGFSLNLLPAEALGGMEVFYGPVSSRYGAGGLSGALNLSSHDSSGNEGRTFIRTAFSSHGGFEKSLRSGFINPRGGGKHSVILKSHIYGGYRPNSHFKAETAAYSHEFNAGRRAGGRFSFLHSSSANGVPGPRPAEGASPVFGGQGASSLFDRQADTLNFAALDLRYDSGSGRALSLKLFNDVQNGYFSTRYNGWGGGPVLSSSEAKTRRRGSYLNYSVPLRRGVVTAGAGRVLDSLASRESLFDVSSSSALAPAENSPSSAASSFWAHYGGGGPDLYLDAAASRDSSGRFEPADSYSAGVSRRIGGGLRLKFYHSRGHRAPTLNDLYYPGAGNPDLRPESGTFNSVSFSGSSRGISRSLTLFDRRTDGMIEWFPDPADPSGFRWTPQNINSFSGRGVSISIDKKISSKLYAGFYCETARYRQKNIEEAYNDFAGGQKYSAVERDARQLPKNRAAVKIYGQLSRRLDFCLSNAYTSKMKFYYSDYGRAPIVEMKEKTIDANLISDMSFFYEYKKGERIDFAVENLFDKNYARRFGSSFADGNFPMPGRSWKIAFNKFY